MRGDERSNLNINHRRSQVYDHQSRSGVEFANSLKRAELMSLCWRSLTQTAVLRLSACIAWLDATQVADWRAARLLFNQVLY